MVISYLVNPLPHANNFAVELGKAERSIEWMNSFAKKHDKNFEVKVGEYSLSTIHFGDFKMISWKGDWTAARQIIVKASDKLSMKVIEAGYHKKENIVQSFFGMSKEFAKVYSGGTLVGNVVLAAHSGRWIIKSEKLV